MQAIDRVGQVIDTVTVRKMAPPERFFHRGDVDDNDRLQLTDAIRILNFLFGEGEEPACLEAADADDNGSIQLTDAIRILSWSFLGTGVLPPPGPPGAPCGGDPVDSPALECDRYLSCS